MENSSQTKDLFATILKWKWHLIILIFGAGILGAIFSSPYFITPHYKSTATIYPSFLKPISDESETEQLLEILQSDDIKFKVINAFDLYKHYGIDKINDRHRVAKIFEIYDGNISVRKTQNEAVKISVLDKDPYLAAEMIDSMLFYFNELSSKINNHRLGEVAYMYMHEMDRKAQEIDSLSVILTKYRTGYGLLDMESQVKRYAEAINNGKNINNAREIIENWEKYGAEYVRIDSLHKFAIRSYDITKTLYEENKMDAEKYTTYYRMVSKPFPADKKTYPVRWLIVLLTMLGATLAGLITIAIVEGKKSNKN